MDIESKLNMNMTVETKCRDLPVEVLQQLRSTVYN